MPQLGGNTSAGALVGTEQVPLLDDTYTTVQAIADLAGGDAVPYDLVVAIGDETTAITTGVAKVTFRAPRAMTLTKVKASLTTASSSGLPTFNVKKNGTTIFTTKVTIDATETTSETAATASVLAVTAIAADDLITIDVDTAGTGAAGAKLSFIGTTP